jgi:membrane protein implicated in regulation of membrane protease activity
MELRRRKFVYNVRELNMKWWMWMALGAVLAATELATPGGFFVIFFAVAAVIVGALSLLGIVRDPIVLWILFSVIALAALRLFRNPLLKRLRKNERPDRVDSLVGEAATASTNIGPGEYGQAELRGSVWKARNVDLRPIAAGQRSRVVAVEGLTLDIRSE